eukprot:3731199-Rhodomonas_salina.2
MAAGSSMSDDPSRRSIAWLLSQQQPDGAFLSYAAPNATIGTVQYADTAKAVIALMLSGYGNEDYGNVTAGLRALTTQLQLETVGIAPFYITSSDAYYIAGSASNRTTFDASVWALHAFRYMLRRRAYMLPPISRRV